MARTTKTGAAGTTPAAPAVADDATEPPVETPAESPTGDAVEKPAESPAGDAVETPAGDASRTADDDASTPQDDDASDDFEVDEDDVPFEIEVIVVTQIAGLRNGEPWPSPGEPMSLPIEEAEQYLDLGIVRLGD